jgi:hypothetical protein
MRYVFAVMALLGLCRVWGGEVSSLQSEEIPCRSKWIDNGLWANSPATLLAMSGRSAKPSDVEVQCRGFAQIYLSLPGLESGKVYRIFFRSRVLDQIEKITMVFRRIEYPYRILGKTEVGISREDAGTIVQLRSPVDAKPGEYGLFLLIDGAGKLFIQGLNIQSSRGFMATSDSAPSHGEVIDNSRFGLGDAGWVIVQGGLQKGIAVLTPCEGNPAKIIQEVPFDLRLGKSYRMEIEGEMNDGHAVANLFGVEKKVIKSFPIHFQNGKWMSKFGMDYPASGLLEASTPVFLELNFDSPAVLSRISIVETQNKDEASLQSPRASVLFFKKDERVFEVLSGIPVRLEIRVTGIEVGRRLSVAICNLEGVKTRYVQGNVEQLSDGTLGFSVKPIILSPGWFDASVSSDKVPVRTLPSELAVLLPSNVKTSPHSFVVGGHLQYWSRPSQASANEGYSQRPFFVDPHEAFVSLERAKDLGITSVRLHPPLTTKWWYEEPSPGKWRFDDPIVDIPLQSGLSVLGMLDGSASHASSAPDDVLKNPDPWPRAWGIYPPKDDNAWREYVRRTVEHYKGRVQAWEIWNEPDSRGYLAINPNFNGQDSAEKIYVGLVKSAAEEIWKIDPDIQVVAGAVTGGGRDFLLRCIDLGLLDSCNVISFHGYGRVNASDQGENAFDDIVAPLKKAFIKAGKVPVIWDSEATVMAAPEGRGDLKYAELELKGILARQATGISRVYLFNGFTKTYPLHEDYRMIWGYNNRPLPVQVLLAAYSHFLGGSRFIQKVACEHTTSHLYLFERDGKRILAGWSSTEGESTEMIDSRMSGKIYSECGEGIGDFALGRMLLVHAVRYFVVTP